MFDDLGGFLWRKKESAARLSRIVSDMPDTLDGAPVYIGAERKV
jgi:hypothetical protein